MNKTYCPSLTEYKRRVARVVNIGGVPLGGNYPIRVQSMTTVDTMDTLGSVEQTLRMVEAGCEYVRITAPSMKEAQNLLEIKKELRKRGCNVPLIADIHFTPNAAELAARIVEKVRVNPGNYADKKKFEEIEYTDATYAAEVERIRERFRPLVQICKQYGTAMRIGTNHGSLSDRILSRYGDTPLGMVESALEFLRLCEEENYYDVVLSMKASNTQVMVQAYRLLVQKLDEEGLQPYPLHLGVTEAGEAEDGRIKSAVGIGTLLEDGLGDTVRVSLTEAPEAEAPVARMLIDRYTQPRRAGPAHCAAGGRGAHQPVPVLPPRHPRSGQPRRGQRAARHGRFVAAAGPGIRRPARRRAAVFAVSGQVSDVGPGGRLHVHGPDAGALHAAQRPEGNRGLQRLARRRPPRRPLPGAHPGRVRRGRRPPPGAELRVSQPGLAHRAGRSTSCATTARRW